MGYWTVRFTEPGRLEDTLGEVLPDKGVYSILDIGCSDGTVAGELNQRYPDASVTGIDLNEEDVATAHRNLPGLEFHMGDGYFPSRLVNSKFDLVLIMNSMINYVLTSRPSKEELAPMLKDISSVVESNGYLVISYDYSYDMYQSRNGQLELIVSSRKNGGDEQFAYVQELLTLS